MPESDRDFWGQRYATDGYLFGTQPAVFLKDNARFLSPRSRVLAVADGEGRNSVFLAQQGHQVVATDIAEQAIEKARRLAASEGVEVDFRQVDLAGWPWPESELDAVVAIFIQFAPPAFRDEIFAGMKRALKPGGLLLLHGYTPKQLDYRTGGPPVEEHLYTEELLRTAFGNFELLRLEAYERELDEGEGHRGMSAVIDLVARRPLA